MLPSRTSFQANIQFVRTHGQYPWAKINFTSPMLLLLTQSDCIGDIIMVPQNDISGATRKAFLYTEKGYRNVIVEKYSGSKD